VSTFIAGNDVAKLWRRAIENKEKPILFTQASEFNGFEIGPGMIALIGGAPGAGKTALTMQMVFEMLRLNTSLRVVVCNVELTPATLLDRELSRQSEVNARAIRQRLYGPKEAIAISEGMGRIDSVMDRIAFMQGPFNTVAIANTVNEFGADLVVVDYIQRIADGTTFNDKRSGIDACMAELRRFANDGDLGLIILSAVNRVSGYSSKDFGLHSFRDSSELEFGADTAWGLIGSDDPEDATLKCLKNRFGEIVDIELKFEKHFQRFVKRQADGIPWTGNNSGGSNGDW